MARTTKKSPSRGELFYILVISPMDQLFVGPFSARHLAERYAKEHRPRGHDCVVMTTAERAENQRLYGVIPLQSPRS